MNPVSNPVDEWPKETGVNLLRVPPPCNDPEDVLLY